MKFLIPIFAIIIMIGLSVSLASQAAAFGDADPEVSDQDDGSIPGGNTGCTGDCDGDRAPDGEVDQDGPVNDQDPVDADPVGTGGGNDDPPLNNGRS